MLIMSQNRKRIANLSNINCLCIVNSAEIAAFVDEVITPIGAYKSKERCMDILRDICDQYTDYVMFPGVGENAVFYMPEE